MVSWMHSVTVGLAGDSESSPPARCSHGVMDAQCYSRDGGDSSGQQPHGVGRWLAVVNPSGRARCSHGVTDAGYSTVWPSSDT
jgi:hypothetical protein